MFGALFQQAAIPERRRGWTKFAVPTAVCLIGWTAVGCISDGAGRREVAAVLDRYAQTISQTAEAHSRIPIRNAPDGDEDAGPVKLSQSPAALRDYIALALRENPSIQAAEATARAKAERIPQVTALPDPTLTLKVLPEPVRTAEGDNFFTMGVSQRFPIPAKLDLKGRIALEEVRAAMEELQDTRLRVIGEVKRAYFQLYVLDKTADVTRTNQNLLRGLIDVARTQVAVGRRNQDDVLRAQVELSNIQAELIDLGRQRVTIVARINKLLSRSPTTPVETPQDFDTRQAEFTVEQLLERAAKLNPKLRRLQTRVKRDELRVELAELADWPDFVLGLEWMSMEPRDAFEPPRNPTTGTRPKAPQMSEDGSDNWAITFGFTVPIWLKKTEAGVSEAKHSLAASRLRYVSTRNEVDFRIADALERVRAQRELATLFKNTVIPQAEQAYRASQSSYTAGTSDFPYVIDNWRKWLSSTIQYHRSLGELERSVADLEQVLGQSLTEVEEPG